MRAGRCDDSHHAGLEGHVSIFGHAANCPLGASVPRRIGLGRGRTEPRPYSVGRTGGTGEAPERGAVFQRPLGGGACGVCCVCDVALVREELGH